jgi:hypothetical protein
MAKTPRSLLPPSLHALALCAITAVLVGCTVGPDFVKPTPAAPDDWTAWHSGDESLRVPVGTGASLPPEWWRSFADPVLDRLQQRAFEANPDLLTAALHFSQARVQRSVVEAQRGPDLAAAGAVTRQRQSENGGGSRVLRAIAGDKAGPASTPRGSSTCGAASVARSRLPTPTSPTRRHCSIWRGWPWPARWRRTTSSCARRSSRSAWRARTSTRSSSASACSMRECAPASSIIWT